MKRIGHIEIGEEELKDMLIQHLKQQHHIRVETINFVIDVVGDDHGPSKGILRCVRITEE